MRDGGDGDRRIQPNWVLGPGWFRLGHDPIPAIQILRQPDLKTGSEGASQSHSVDRRQTDQDR